MVCVMCFRVWEGLKVLGAHLIETAPLNVTFEASARGMSSLQYSLLIVKSQTEFFTHCLIIVKE